MKSQRADQPLWYNPAMINFGKGPTLREACPWLRDEAEWKARILDVTERDSVIEGLPRLRLETRQRILRELSAASERHRARQTSPQPSVGNP